MSTKYTYKSLIGQVCNSVVKLVDEYNDEGIHKLIFKSDEAKYTFEHKEGCCERVTLDHIEGDLNNLIGVPIKDVTRRVIRGTKNEYETFQWTLFTYTTDKGIVKVLWLGENSCYCLNEVEPYKAYEVNLTVRKRKTNANK